MSGTIRYSAHIYRPAPDDMRYFVSEPEHFSGVHVQISDSIVFVMGDKRFTTDLAAEAAAMRLLAEAATTAAEELELRAATNPSEYQQPSA